MLIDDKSLQREMQVVHAYAGLIDGKFGPKSIAATREIAEASQRYAPTWSDARCRLAAEQFVFKSHGFYSSVVDGIPGPATQVALENWQDFIQFVRPSPNPSAGVGASNNWPRQGYAEMVKFYGEPGKNQAMLVMPFPLFLDWDLSEKINRFSIHEKCHDSALRVYNRVLDHYGPATLHEMGLDQFGGCLNVRKMRGGNAWSMHAWGVAIDTDPNRNQLRMTMAQAQMGKPEYSKFLDLWEEEGWISLGRARNYDPMHVQAARF